MKEHKAQQKGFRVVWLAASAAALAGAVLLALLWPSGDTAPGEMTQAVDTADAVVVQEGAELLQTLTYTRCEHRVTRRVTAPVELYDKTLAQVEALYPEWRITEFAPKLIKMEQRPDLFCPDHLVVMTDAAGRLCVFENKYGDALALVKELSTDVTTLPAAVREELDDGVGFATPQELEQWLESVES